MHKTKVFGAQILVLASLVGSILILAHFLPARDYHENSRVVGNDAMNYPEVAELEAKNISSFQELSGYFTQLAEEKGGEYAFRVLAAVQMPIRVDTHLMGHIVGDVLYKQLGVDGIKACTHDFRNACSHSIVVGTLLEKGEESMSQITDACELSPGGPGAYIKCFHGLGHGVLAYVGYNLPDAIKICEKINNNSSGTVEAVECIGGAVMEIIGGGAHNRELWEIQSLKYLPQDKPLYPCESDYMPKEAVLHCYLYLTPRLFIAAGGKQALVSPTPADFERAFEFCSEIPEEDAPKRDACYGGFGKEFIVIVNDLNTRDISNMTEEKMAQAYEWCRLAKNDSGIFSCVKKMANSVYWGGENDRGALIRLCGVITEPQIQDACFIDAIGLVDYFNSDRRAKIGFCAELPPKYEPDCHRILN